MFGSCRVPDIVKFPVAEGQALTAFDAGLSLKRSLSGVITRSSDGAPVSGVMVCAQLPLTPTDIANAALTTSACAVSAIDGTYTIDELPDRPLQLTYSSAAYVPVTINPFDPAATPGQVSFIQDVVLDAWPLITGVVTAESDGQPLGGVQVCAFTAPAGTIVACTETAPSGAYSLIVNSVGGLAVRFVPNNAAYLTEFAHNASYLSTANVVTLGLGDAVVFDEALALGSVIEGIVTDEVSGLPLAGQQVCYLSQMPGTRCTLSSADGTYRFDSLPAGDYTISAGSVGGLAAGALYIGEYWENAFTLDSANTVALGAGDVRGDVNFALARTAWVSGSVTDAIDGHLLIGARVCIATWFDNTPDQDATCVDSSDGHYVFTNVAPGDYYLWFSASGHIAEFSGDTNNFNIAQTVAVPAVSSQVTGVNAALNPAAQITGSIGLDVPMSEDVDLEVCAFLSDGTSTCVPTGFGDFVIPGLAPGTYTIRVTDSLGNVWPEFWKDVPAYDLISVTAVTLDVGQDLYLGQIDLQPRSRVVESTVVSGSAPVGLPVTVCADNGDDEPTCLVTTDGSFRLTGLVAGTYHVTVTADGYLPFEADWTIAKTADGPYPVVSLNKSDVATTTTEAPTTTVEPAGTTTSAVPPTSTRTSTSTSTTAAAPSSAPTTAIVAGSTQTSTGQRPRAATGFSNAALLVVAGIAVGAGLLMFLVSRRRPK